MSALSPSFTVDALTGALAGGVVLGTAALLKLKMNGNILGISDIVGGMLAGPVDDKAGRMWFALGLPLAGLLLRIFRPDLLQTVATDGEAFIRMAVGGLLVGAGTSGTNCCTSGHGISGLTRFSPRSFAATCTFMGTGAIMATILSTGAWADSGAHMSAGVAAMESMEHSAGMGRHHSGKPWHAVMLGVVIWVGYVALMVLLAATKSATKTVAPTVVELATGMAFGLGLGVAGMVKPSRVAHFLDFSEGIGGWDPTLAFVMGGALCLTVPVYQLWLKKTTPVFAEALSLPSNDTIDRQVLTGAALFGAGWGVAGVCPGPLLVSLGGIVTLHPEDLLPWLVFLLAVGLGWGVVPRLNGQSQAFSFNGPAAIKVAPPEADTETPPESDAESKAEL